MRGYSSKQIFILFIILFSFVTLSYLSYNYFFKKPKSIVECPQSQIESLYKIKLNSNQLNIFLQSTITDPPYAAQIISHKFQCVNYNRLNLTVCPKDNITYGELLRRLFVLQSYTLGDFSAEIAYFSFSTDPTEEELFKLADGNLENLRDLNQLRIELNGTVQIKDEFSSISLIDPYIFPNSNSQIDFLSDRKIKSISVIGDANSTLRKINDYQISGNLEIPNLGGRGIKIEFE